MAHIPNATLNNGVVMPQFGLGTYLTNDGQDIMDSIHFGVENGYRLIDTAALYGNEVGVGEAVRTCGVAREELFIQTKVWNSEQGRDKTLRAFDTSLKKLDMDYVDMYLIHWPVPSKGKYVETWKMLEEIYESGRAKAIGVCNFNVEHLEALREESKIVPAVNQIELHPYLSQREVRDYCKKNGIHVESWAPIGGQGGNVLDDPAINEIAGRLGKTSAQVTLRWHIQNGLVPLPKSIHAERIIENVSIFDFELSKGDMAVIDSLNTNSRVGPDPATFDRN